MPELLTMKEVAELARVAPSTVSRWVSAGKIPVVVLPSGQVRFTRHEIEQMLTPVKMSAPSPSRSPSDALPGQGALL